jgi:hypothetical protein
VDSISVGAKVGGKNGRNNGGDTVVVLVEAACASTV